MTESVMPGWLYDSLVSPLECKFQGGRANVHVCADVVPST